VADEADSLLKLKTKTMYDCEHCERPVRMTYADSRRRWEHELDFMTDNYTPIPGDRDAYGECEEKVHAEEKSLESCSFPVQKRDMELLLFMLQDRLVNDFNSESLPVGMDCGTADIICEERMNSIRQTLRLIANLKASLADTA